jgi:hypothetical protein
MVSVKTSTLATRRHTHSIRLVTRRGRLCHTYPKGRFMLRPSNLINFPSRGTTHHTRSCNRSQTTTIPRVLTRRELPHSCLPRSQVRLKSTRMVKQAGKPRQAPISWRRRLEGHSTTSTLRRLRQCRHIHPTRRRPRAMEGQEVS